MSPFLAVDLIGALFAMATGAALIWFPHRHRLAAQQRHETRLNELNAGAEEQYFEERRSLEAYRPPTSDWVWRLFGGMLFLFGAFQAYTLIVR